MPWICSDCEYENDDKDERCGACDAERSPAAAAQEGTATAGSTTTDRFANYVVGQVESLKEMKKPLRCLSINVGDAEPVQVVTNAQNVREGSRIVVALLGAMVGDEVVKKVTVGGEVSQGMLCDSKMLGWTGGAEGVAAQVPESFALGSRPPDAKPRGDTK